MVSHDHKVWHQTLALTSVSIVGPITGVPGTAYAFNASVLPSFALTPITVNRQATDQTTVSRVINTTTDSIQFTWPAPGTYVVQVTVENTGAPRIASHIIQIQNLPAASGNILLPAAFVGRNGP